MYQNLAVTVLYMLEDQPYRLDLPKVRAMTVLSVAMTVLRVEVTVLYVPEYGRDCIICARIWP